MPIETKPQILLVMDDDVDHSQAMHILTKYRFANSVLRLRRPLDLSRYLEDPGGPADGRRESPEMIIFSAGDADIGQFCSSAAFVRTLTREVPLIVVAHSVEAERALAGFKLAMTYVLGKPLGFFKLLEAMQKLGLYWTVRRTPD